MKRTLRTYNVTLTSSKQAQHEAHSVSAYDGMVWLLTFDEHQNQSEVAAYRDTEVISVIAVS